MCHRIVCSVIDIVDNINRNHSHMLNVGWSIIGVTLMVSYFTMHRKSVKYGEFRCLQTCQTPNITFCTTVMNVVIQQLNVVNISKKRNIWPAQVTLPIHALSYNQGLCVTL